MNPARKGPDTTTYVGRVAAHINKLRVKAGLSVPELAEAVGVGTPTVYAWENGQNAPQIKMLPLIAKALGVATVRNVLPPE